MKYLKTSIYLFIAIFLGACSNSVDIVENGDTNYAIIIAQQPNEQESRAASLLQEYIEKMTGCKIPITNKLNEASEKGIFIKEVKGLQWDGYAIKTSKDGNVFIDGGKFRGCVYGVVEILDKYLGCHVYTAKYKVIPQINDISLSPLNISDSSVNYCRIVHFHSSTISDQDVLDWCRISTGSVDYISVHSLTNSLVPWRKYFDTHPEYFAWRNSDGKRMPTQACVSNKEVLRIVIEELEQKMALNPQINYWDVSQDDNRAYCECENCLKIMDEEKSPGGPIFRFVNEVAKHFPDKIISTLAYQYSRPAPVVTKPLDNVRIVLCSIEADRSRSIVDDTTSVGRSFVRDLEDWGKICKQIYLWDYIVNFHYYLAPFPNLHTLQPNIKLFVDNNVHE
ncbi:MAG: DUF4838 domain-containing protein, partial [Cyclobacteriaceae bacterium]|nr:DUF4838 domain-containing protein [Cyclobacteriaceae bacterium]